MTAASAAALRAFRTAFAKDFGEGTLKLASELDPYEVISSGSLMLDRALVAGGYVRGRIVESWGPGGVGKTAMALIGIAEAQRAYPDLLTGYVDMEHTFDPGIARAFGVDVEALEIMRPASAEDVADAMKRMVSSELF